MALLDTIKSGLKKAASWFDGPTQTYQSPGPMPQVSGTATSSSAGAVAAPTMPRVAQQTVSAPSAPRPQVPAAAAVTAAVAPTIQRLQQQAGTPATTPAPSTFTVDTTDKTTSDQLNLSSRGGLEKKRSDLERQLAKLREPSREQIRAREQLTRAEQALANVTAGQTARLADLRYYNPEGVFGGGVATREGQIGRESTLQAIQAQGALSAAQSAYDRLDQARQQEIENLKSFQSLTMPEVLGTPTVNKQTGDVTAYIQRPDGTIGVEVIGNAGIDESFDLQSVVRNEGTGQSFAIGTRAGEVVALPLSGTAGLAPVAGGLGGVGGSFVGLSADGYDTAADFSSVLASTKGGKLLTGEQTTPISRALQAMAQVTDVGKTLVSESTGPIWGTVRSANPYDVKAQTVAAQLQALIPNLARGVYGEVGVLTDQDIANYSRTIPNLRSVDEVNKAILGLTQKAILNSVQSNLEVMAASGRDVSGFAPIYERTRATVESNLSASGVDDEYEAAKREAESGAADTSSGGIVSWFTNLFS